MTHNSETYLFNLEAVRDAVGEDFDDLDEPEPEPKPARLDITTLAGNRVPVIDPYGCVSWDAP